ncbi:anti-sigma factor [Conexibacter sp. JD483]|uniref:anti-sigma factor n=1 Tax=Conexibacter sp. JD483 TaxID=3064471 RepID=UPI0037BF0901
MEIREIGIGRTVDLRTDALPLLPRGDYYEVWFVGPGDRPGRPNRISAGTFHPDRAGRSNVQLKAAVDPALYPTVEITAEPGDGNPAATGPEVMRAEVG